MCKLIRFLWGSEPTSCWRNSEKGTSPALRRACSPKCWPHTAKTLTTWHIRCFMPAFQGDICAKLLYRQGRAAFGRFVLRTNLLGSPCPEQRLRESKLFRLLWLLQSPIFLQIRPCQPNCINVHWNITNPSRSPQEIKLAANDATVRTRHDPFFDSILRAEIECFHHCHLVCEGSFAVGHFVQRRIEALDRVGSVDHFPYFGGVVEYLLNIDKVVVPDEL